MSVTTYLSLVTYSVGLVFVGLLTVPALNSLFGRFFNGKHGHRVLDQFYEDEDGEARSMQEAYDRPQRMINIICLVSSALLSLVRGTVPGLSSNTAFSAIHCWLLFVISILLVLQGSALSEPRPAVRYHLGLQNGSSCAVAAIGLAVEAYSQYHSRHTTLQFPVLVQIVLMILGACCALLLRRRPDVYHNGAIIDRHNTGSFLSWLTFSTTTSLRRAVKKNRNIDIRHLPGLSSKVRAKGLHRSFMELTAVCHSGLWMLLIRSHRRSLIIQMALALVSSLTSFFPQLSLLMMLRTLEMPADKDRGGRLGLSIGALCISSLLSGSLMMWKYWMSVNVIATRAYAQLTSIIFDKSMRLNGIVRNDDGDGDDETGDRENGCGNKHNTVNLVATDASRTAAFLGDSYQLIEPPLKLVITCAVLVNLLDWKSVLAGFLVIFLCVPANSYVMKKYAFAQGRLLSRRDLRMSMVAELLRCVNQVKFTAGEDGWEGRINESRDIEVEAQSRVIFWNVIAISIFVAEPIVLSAVTLSVNTFFHPDLTASTAFTSITILELVEDAMDRLTEIQVRLLNVSLFVQRMEQYLQLREIQSYIVQSDQIELRNVNMVWPGCEVQAKGTRFGLNDVNLKFPNGALSVVSGGTGSGKSLLLACLIGEASILFGTVKGPVSLTGVPSHFHPQVTAENSTAYVSQVPWIESGTVKDNILFGNPYDPERYKEVLYACALYPDFEVFSNGDLTQVGSGGVSLSGGQKARLALARALYSHARVMILDDVFSAVDVHTARHLFENALSGPLALGRTRILATYHVDLCLPQIEYLICLNRDGTCQASPVKPKNRRESLSVCQDEADTEMETPGAKRKKNYNPRFARNRSHQSDPAQPEGIDITPSRRVGAIQWQVIKEFITIFGDLTHWIIVVVFFAVYGTLMLGRGYAIKLWTSDTHGSQMPNSVLNPYFFLYLTLSGAAILVGSFRTHLVLSVSLRGSSHIFRQMLHAILRVRLRWLDLTPLGNLVSRFSADFAVLDSQIGQSLKQVLVFVVNILISMGSGMIEDPKLIGCSAILLTICFWYARDYVIVARELKRLESISLGPIFDHFSSSTAGLCTIRSFGRVESYVEGVIEKIDLHSRALWQLCLFNAWMGYRMNVAGAIFSTVTAASIIQMKDVNAATAGFAISFTMRLARSLTAAVEAYAKLEMDMNSIERVVEYTHLQSESDTGKQPPAAWPTNGRLEVCDLTASYSSELAPALHDLTFSVESNQRVGIVGRTGAGKSSLSLALMRFLDISRGQIFIDSIDITQVALQTLRKRVALIPQTPILFSGTVRSNMDPFGEHDDLDLLAALESVHWPPSDCLESSQSSAGTPVSPVSEVNDINGYKNNEEGEITDSPESSTTLLGVDKSQDEREGKFPSALDRVVSEGGLNLSPGERQIICLARAILTRPKILILDESTSSVDRTTDGVIQQSIREEFKNHTTLLVIAHRLQTIIDFDRILVLDNGHADEFGSPSELMRMDNGIFRSLVEEDAESETLKRTISQSM